jgi:hypothetical protein
LTHKRAAKCQAKCAGEYTLRLIPRLSDRLQSLFARFDLNQSIATAFMPRFAHGNAQARDGESKASRAPKNGSSLNEEVCHAKPRRLCAGGWLDAGAGTSVGRSRQDRRDNDQSGMYADITGPRSVAAVKMAVEDFGGTVMGKPIEVVVGDHQNKVDIAAAIAQKWIEVDHVDVITDATGSGVALALQEITRRTNRNLLVASAASSDLTGSKCSDTGTHWAYDIYSLAKGTAREITRQGGDSWFFITADYAFGHAMQRDATTFIEQSGGIILGSVSPPQGTTDYASSCCRLKRRKQRSWAWPPLAAIRSIP